MRTLILALLTLTAIPAFSQFEISNPFVSTATCANASIEQVHVYPDKITVDFLYLTDAQNGGYRYSSGSYINYRNFETKRYVSGLKNADYANFTYVKGKKGRFSASFPFSYYDLMANSPNALLSQIDKFPFLQLDVINCSTSDMALNNIDESKCFNFYGVDLGLKPDQVEALYLCGLLDKSTVKGEFETTAAFAKRTSPDSLTVLLSGYIDIIESIYEQKQFNSMAATSPVVEYNADNETFTIQYANCEPFLVKVPLANAPAFKKALIDRTKIPQKARIVRKPNGRFYIKEIYFGEKGKDSKELTSVVNLTVEDSEGYYKATVARVLAELKRIYPKGQLWK